MEKPTTLEQIGRLIPLFACLGLLWCSSTLLETPGVYFGLMLVAIAIPLKYIRIRKGGVAILMTVWIIFLMSGTAVLITHNWPRPPKSELMDADYMCKENIHVLYQMIDIYTANEKRLPPLVTKDSEGNPLHSWRVLMLPTLKHQGFDQIDLEQPWNSEKNLSAFKKIPISKMLRCPNAAGITNPTYTNYVAYTGPDSGWDESSTLDPSEQILLIETDRPIPWYEPRDLSDKDLPEGVTDPRHLSGSLHHYDDGLFHYRENKGGHIIYRSSDLELFKRPGKVQLRWKNIGLAGGILLFFILALAWPINKSTKNEDSTPNDAPESPIEEATTDEKT